MTDETTRTDEELAAQLEADQAALEKRRADRAAQTAAKAAAAAEEARVDEANVPPESAPEQPVVEDKPKAKRQKPLDLARALRPLNENVRSTNLNPDWAGGYALLGQIVAYVMPDGSDTEAKILDLRSDGAANLLISVGVQTVDLVYQRQEAAVPLGRSGEVGTWHEVDDG